MSGYTPAINVTGTLPQSTVRYHDKIFRENLKAQTPFVACAERLDLPMNRGNQYVMYMYTPFAANTTQVTEGTVGTSIQATVLNNASTIGEYAKV